MNGRERFLTALKNQKPDRLPCQVHSWMTYYLDTYLNGMDSYQAYDYFGMDPVIYACLLYTSYLFADDCDSRANQYDEGKRAARIYCASAAFILLRLGKSRIIFFRLFRCV